MDTPIILFVIFGIILWIDSKRRNKRIQKRWEEVGGWKPFQVPITPTPENVPTTEELENTLWKLHEDLTGNKRPDPEPEPDVDDIALNETIREVIKEMTPTPPTNLAKAEVADAETGLQRLGYKKLQIRKAIAHLDIAHKTSAEIITQALPLLNK